MLFTKEIEEILSYYETIEKMFSQDLKTAPPGTLIVQNNHGRKQYLQKYKEEDRWIRKGITRNEELKRALARKEFARKALEVLSPNIEALRQAVNAMKPFDPDQLLQAMTKGYENLPKDYFFDRAGLVANLHLPEETQERINRHKEWGEQPYKQSDYMSEYKNMRTSRGLCVRSKSELLIAECLYKYGIPFRYEEEKIIGSLIIAADFTFEDSYGRSLYHEHLGRMDDPNYAERNFKKLNRYYSVGIVPGNNLILSFDRNGTIDMSVIDSIIQTQIIPKL